MHNTRTKRNTLILLLWGMAGAPLFAGTVTSQTPKLSLVIGTDLTSQLSGNVSENSP